jgi:uncharacterized lipoprotein
MKTVVFFLLVVSLSACSDLTIKNTPLPTSDEELSAQCFHKMTTPPNFFTVAGLDRITTKCDKVAKDYSARRIKEGKVPYENDPNLIYWHFWLF